MSRGAGLIFCFVIGGDGQPNFKMAGMAVLWTLSKTSWEHADPSDVFVRLLLLDAERRSACTQASCIATVDLWFTTNLAFNVSKFYLGTLPSSISLISSLFNACTVLFVVMRWHPFFYISSGRDVPQDGRQYSAGIHYLCVFQSHALRLLIRS